MHTYGATVKGINTVNTLPDKINELKDLADQLEDQMDLLFHADVEQTDANEFEKVRTAFVDTGFKFETPEVETLKEVEVKNPLLDKLKIALNPYLVSTNSRTNEYYYGFIGTALSFFNLGGYSKTQKLGVIDKLFLRAQNLDSELTQDDVTMLTNGVLGDAINPLLEDKDVGELLRAALTISQVKRPE